VTSDLDSQRGDAILLGARVSIATAPIARFIAQQVSHAIISAAMKVHTELGPGLLESTYTACLQYELGRPGTQSAAQVGLPVVYCGVKLELGYRIDLFGGRPCGGRD
jgi:hypothetical protein